MLFQRLHDIQSRVLKTYCASLYSGGIKTVDAFNRQAWRAMRDFYNGETDAFGFIDDMVEIIDNQYGRAFREGARDMNIDPRTFTDEDMAVLQKRIQQEQDHILGLADDIEQARAAGSGVAQFRGRAGLWANRYDEVVTMARAQFGGRQLLEWQLGPTEQHCTDAEGGYGCAQLAGTVATADDWTRAREMGIYPKSPELSCHGYNCGCGLVPTDKKPTEGGIPVKSLKYSPDQPRDDHGRWVDEGGGSVTILPPSEITTDVNIERTGVSIVNQTTYRFGDPSGDVIFYSRDRDYAEEYAIIRGGSRNGVREYSTTINNPLVIDAPPDRFSDPDYESPILDWASNNNYDGVVFTDKENDMEFYAVINR